MRISDWSSDVCSSDLIHRALVLAGVAHHHRDQALVAALGRGHQAVAGGRGVAGLDAVDGRVAPQQQVAVALGDRADREFLRSEEHTSELQSLMRISYAVFCLKKKKKI